MSIISLIILITTFILMAMLDVPKLWRSKFYKDLVIYLSIWSIALVITVLLVNEVKVPSPAKVITRILEPYVPKLSGQ